MTQTLADFAAQLDALNDIKLKIREHCLTLCDLLVKDFMRVNNNKTDGYKFYIESGRKYHRIIMETGTGSRSVHAFIDMNTGEVYKPASWKAPAKIVRYNLLIIESREECFARADWAGSYLYVR
tara:strand:+ start:6006 stop:6377 length:372 start_codon:yes stop_codon:yes gene_type:complete